MTDQHHDSAAPLLLAAFEGWGDAGNSASQALAIVSEEWNATVVHQLDPELFHDFQVTRPMVGRDAEGLRTLEWPATTISHATSPRGRRVVLVEGIEPSFRWRTYCAQILAVAKDLNVKTVASVGALLADVPHTRPLPVSITSDDPVIRALLDIERSDYEGPSGISGVLAHQAAEAGMRTLSLWATVPHYVSQPPTPKSTLALLRAIETVLGESFDVPDLIEDAEAWQTGVDDLAASDPDVAQYVAQLEEVKDTADLPEASGDAIAEEFERYLRRHGEDGPGRFGNGQPPKPRP